MGLKAAAPVPTASPDHSPLLGAWRGVAALAVVLFHSFGAFYQAPLWGPLVPVRAVAAWGWLGLHVFFVISGYCICARLTRALRTGESVPAFWLDRARRIYPTYWIALLAAAALNGLTRIFSPGATVGVLPDNAAAAAADLTLTHLFAGTTPYLLVSWTLALEVGFYLLAGGVLAVCRLLQLGPQALLLLAGTAALPGIGISAAAAGPLALLAAWPEFFAGMCVAAAAQSRSRGDRRGAGIALGLLAAMSFLAAGSVGSYAGTARVSALGFAWLLVLLQPWENRLAAAAPVRWLGWIGLFSFSLYLVHVPVLTRILNLGRRFVAAEAPLFALVWLAGVAAAVAAGRFFYVAVERRAEANRFARRAALR